MASRSEDSYPEIIESGGRERNTEWVVDINFLTTFCQHISIILGKVTNLADYC